MLQVGPGRSLSVPSEAAQIARDGDVVEISAAFYEGDVAIWPQNDLTILGVGGRAHVGAGRQFAEDKGIWVIKGRNATVEHVELSGARGPHRNGCGIRGEEIGAKSFTLRASYSHHTRVGHNVKSRAAATYVLYNRIMDEVSGGAAAAGAGTDAGSLNGFSLTPVAQYAYRTAEEPWPCLGAVDIGASGCSGTGRRALNV